MPALIPDVHLTPDVTNILWKQNADEEFSNTLEILAEWFPEAVMIHPFLCRATGEPQYWKIMMRTVLPQTLPIEVWTARRRGFATDWLKRYPPPYRRTCVLYLDFTENQDAYR